MTIVRIIRNHGGVVGSPSNVPDYWPDLADSTWLAVSNNNLEDVRPSGVGASTIANVMVSWNGATLHQTLKRLILWDCGGHGNYSGNEGYEFDLFTGLWGRFSDPSAAAASGGVASNGIKTDGSAISTHTYQNLAYANGMIYLCMLGSTSPDGDGSLRMFRMDRASADLPATGTRGYIDLGFSPTSGTVKDGFADFDPITNKVWYGQRRQSTGGSNSQFGSIDMDDTVTAYALAVGSIGSISSYSAGVCIYRGSTSALLCYGDTAIRTLNLQSPALAAPVFTGSTPEGDARHGVVYEANNEQLIALNPDGSGNLRVCNAPSDLYGGTFDWFDFDAAGSIDTLQPNGTYNRFNIVRDMGDGRSALVLANSTSTPVYVLKIPSGGFA
jgi:hypothetical protein